MNKRVIEFRWFFLVILVLVCLTAMGCKQIARTLTASNSHEKFGWKAEDFFDDPAVVELCDAIVANDLEKMKQLIDAGVNVNAKGKDGMTPLFWSFWDDHPERFEMLLEAGADPNVFLTGDLGLPELMLTGTSVTHMACRSSFSYFDAVFDHGGDPNLVSQSVLPFNRGRTPIFTVIDSGGPDVNRRLKRLIDLGVDVNQREPEGSLEMTPAMFAAGFFGQYDVCLFLLQNGADPSIYKKGYLGKLTHVLARSDGLLEIADPKQKADYAKLVAWLKEHGESVEEAREDQRRYRSYIEKHNKYERKKLFAADAKKNKERWLEQQKKKKNVAGERKKSP